MPDPASLPELVGLDPTLLGVRSVALHGIGPPEDLFAIRRPGRPPLRVERDGRGAVHIEPAGPWPIMMEEVAVPAGLEAWLHRTPPRLGGATPCEARA